MRRIIFYLIGVSVLSPVRPKECDTCILSVDCPLFTNMTQNQQKIWIEKFLCMTDRSSDYDSAFSLLAQGWNVCCSPDLWDKYKNELETPISINSPIDDVENNDVKSQNTYPESKTKRETDSYVWYPDRTANFDNSNYWANNTNSTTAPVNETSQNVATDKQRYRNDRPWNSLNYPQYNTPGNEWGRPQNQWNVNNPQYNRNPRNQWNNGNVNNPQYNRPGNQWNTGNINNPQYYNPGNQWNNVNNPQNNRPGNQWNNGNINNPQYNRPGNQWNNGNLNNPGNQWNNGINNPQYNRPGNQWNTGGQNVYPPNNFNPSGGQYANSGQCDRVATYPPEPSSGCCGREASDDERITEISYPPINFAPAYSDGVLYDDYTAPDNTINNDYYDYLDLLRDKVEPENQTTADLATKINSTTITIEKRISGGKETALFQYPWTVLLLTTFDYGDRESQFNCGGSLISSNYVLSAGHCVSEKDGRVKSVLVYLAEYDRRTFPNDCREVRGKKRCIQNMVVNTEDVLVHPKYDDESLENDISLLRLERRIPYTENMRPICLPTINIDSPEYNNAQFEVAGWGRNGVYKSDVKQSTFIRLVTQDKCKTYYPNLTPKHMCAAGSRGEDTCKGDSGGPLMTLYRGRYYVSGVVSGKRADTPCGTAVPSLYTNVFLYRDWILNNIRN